MSLKRRFIRRHLNTARREFGNYAAHVYLESYRVVTDRHAKHCEENPDDYSRPITKPANNRAARRARMKTKGIRLLSAVAATDQLPVMDQLAAKMAIRDGQRAASKLLVLPFEETIARNAALAALE